ncbi:DNase I-like protein [Ascobolus immersus RN42]|uniref:DNase I-like protein n=1 Tax=Ascobolus immersus RN42 TaxID=1160509 RepID=A0A3N4I6W6_ASCIM|nr:DNase I-like protein [Ascobolus immersus RN42]
MVLSPSICTVPGLRSTLLPPSHLNNHEPICNSTFRPSPPPLPFQHSFAQPAISPVAPSQTFLPHHQSPHSPLPADKLDWSLAKSYLPKAVNGRGSVLFSNNNNNNGPSRPTTAHSQAPAHPQHPPPSDDANGTFQPHKMLGKMMRARRKEFLEPASVNIKCGTWNVAALPVGEIDKGLLDWFGPDEKGEDVGIYVLGLQEVVDVNATESYIKYIDPAVPQNWNKALEAVLPDGFECIASHQLIGMLMLIYVSPSVKPHISSQSLHSVGTGLMGYMGNKGAVGARLVLGETTRVVILNCHLAAMATAVDRRNWDCGEIEKRILFDPVERNFIGIDDDGPSGQEEGLQESDVVIWLGDFNYRIDLPNEEIRQLLGPYMPTDFPPILPPSSPVTADSKGSFSYNMTSRGSVSEPLDGEVKEELETEVDNPPPNPDGPKTLSATLQKLLEKDQLFEQQRLRRAFDGYKEGKINFLPTYRYEVGTIGKWDASEKMRAPSWCDRVLYKVRNKVVREHIVEVRKGVLPGSFDSGNIVFDRDAESSEDEDLVVAVAEEEVSSDSSEKQLNLTQSLYTSHQTVTASDHKPVTALFTLTYPSVNPASKSTIQQAVAKEMDKFENERRPVVTVVIEPENMHTTQRDGIINFGPVHFAEEKRRSITVANTGVVRADVYFVSRPSPIPQHSEFCKRWLRVSFYAPDGTEIEAEPDKIISLEPGDTLTARISLRVSTYPLLDALNRAREFLDDVLVFRVEGGRDVFLMITGQWQQTCLGRTLAELVTIPENSGGARSFFDPANAAPKEEPKSHWSAPREIYRMTDFLLDKIKTYVSTPPTAGGGSTVVLGRHITHPGWPFDFSKWTNAGQLETPLTVVLQDALDTDEPFDVPEGTTLEDQIEQMAGLLIRFFRLLPDGVLPAEVYEKVIRANGNRRLSDQLLESLPPANLNIFVYLTGFLSEMIKQLSLPPPLAPPPPPPPSKNPEPIPDTTEAAEKSLPPTPMSPLSPTTSTTSTTATKRPPSRASTIGFGISSATAYATPTASEVRRRMDRKALAQQIAGVFAEVLVHRPKGSGGSRRAEGKIRGFLEGFLEVE